VHSLRPFNSQLTMKRPNFQLAPEEKSLELTGFPHNAVCPIGLLKKIPIIVCESCLHLSPPIIWMGGGEVDLKLGTPLVDFISAVGALVADVSDPRGDNLCPTTGRNIDSNDD
jgi:prolyl-tRNA editing enzyme YbaK/EbsC (Cys-tRNA(Pro) deacylase)